MPLIKFDIFEGRSNQQIRVMLDAAHRAMLAAFKVPQRDRYQIVNEHHASRMIVEDTGLGIERTDKVVVVTVISRPRSEQEKTFFYAELCRELKISCGIEESDVVVSFVNNTDADWSFGNGRAQFLTGELGGGACQRAKPNPSQ
ncbi:tautomerase family protein [Dyella choica]|uniref:Tautomerase family protein n=1 Tax=Dyella choica TaxID=1927959 RepID=A0A3S0PNN9_9GAMM|nr:tautomerase family protein [Dyella choica]RUL77635.1 tautomerase family protein [Dyella choica]